MWPCRGDNVKIHLWERMGVIGQRGSEGRHFRKETQCMQVHWGWKQERGRFIPGPEIRVWSGCRGQGDNTELAGNYFTKQPVKSQGHLNFILKAKSRQWRVLRWRSDLRFGNLTLRNQKHPKMCIWQRLYTQRKTSETKFGNEGTKCP